MKNPLLTLDALPRLRHTLGLVVVALVGSAAAQSPLAPAGDRISDAVISADQRSYEALQARIKALNDGGRPLRDRHLAQAQCWLDTSFHEYSRNDRGPWPQAALNEARTLVGAMEARQEPLPPDTPLVAGAERIRPDLWQRASALRSQPGWACAQAKAACGEVELVHAGHEQVQLGWRHAKPYVQIAEDLIGEAEAQARACTPPPPVVAAVVPPPPPALPPPPPAPQPRPVISPATPAPVPSRELQLSAQVVFRFDRANLADVPAGGLASLQTLLQRLRDERLELDSVLLTGHADRLNGTGKADYNQALSERRVRAVRDHLVAQGLPLGKIRVEGRGDRQPREACDRLAGGSASLRDCLLPNRRVEVIVNARRP